MPQVCFNLNSILRRAREFERGDVRGPGAINFAEAVMKPELVGQSRPQVFRFANVQGIVSSGSTEANDNVDAGNGIKDAANRADL